MADLIDRQKAMAEAFTIMIEGEPFEIVQMETLLGLPSEHQWVPVTERLPEVDENVLVSYHFDADTEFPPFDGVTISYWTGVKNHNIPHFADMGDACTILAWMPLPEPYREEGKQE